MNLGRPIYHAHYLSKDGIRDAKSWLKRQMSYVPDSVGYFDLLGKKVRANLGKAHFSVITGVRDPIAKEISGYFELADKIDMGIKGIDGSYDPRRVEEYLMDRFSRFDVEENGFFTTKWFDQELKGTFGIDVFEYPFDKERGYSVIRHNNLELLMYQFEKLPEIFSSAISELLNLHDVPELERRNVGEAKWYAELYANVKANIVVPVEICKKVYSTKYVRHFYSSEMIEEFVNEWSVHRV